MRCVFETWAKPKWGTVARFRNIDGWALTYRVQEVNVAWDAFNAGAKAVMDLTDEQRRLVVFE